MHSINERIDWKWVFKSVFTFEMNSYLMNEQMNVTLIMLITDNK